MKIGVNLLNFGPGVTPEALLGWTQLAETLGYHFVMISDHVAMTPDVVARYPAPLYDPFVTLAWLARATRRLELGTTVVILPYRHPLHTARLAANIDRLSGGRFIFGVGVGWAKQEFEALGLPFERRGAMSSDYLAAIKTAWTSDPASYSGPFVSFRDVQTGPSPVRTPHPPVWVGGGSEAAMRRAVRLGDAWHPIRIRVPAHPPGHHGVEAAGRSADRGRGEPRPGPRGSGGAAGARCVVRAPRHVHGRRRAHEEPRARVADADRA